MRFKLSVLYFLLRLKWQKWWFRNRFPELRHRHWNAMHPNLLRSPYYTPYADQGKSIEEYPIIDKSIFMANFTAINTVGIEQEAAYSEAELAERNRSFTPTINGVTVGLSSGTSGNRGIFLATETERARWVAAILDRVIGFSFRKRSVAFFLRANSNLYSSVKSNLLHFEYFDLLIPVEEQLNYLQELNPTILVAQPSLLLELAKAIKGNQLQISPEKVISVAEVLTPEDRKVLEGVFGDPIHQVYQCTEGFLAASCAYGVLHFNEDFLHIERKYLDPEQRRFHPVITDLMRTSQPVIRYELNDIIHVKTEPCPCGSSWLAIEQIEGRSDDVLEFIVQSDNQSIDQLKKAKPECATTSIAQQRNTVRIYPDFIRRSIIMADPKISVYEVVQITPQEISLYIEGSEESFHLAEEALKALLSNYGLCYIEVSEKHHPSRIPGAKLRRIRNDTRQAR